MAERRKIMDTLTIVVIAICAGLAVKAAKKRKQHSQEESRQE